MPIGRNRSPRRKMPIEAFYKKGESLLQTAHSYPVGKPEARFGRSTAAAAVH
jgi:hypothetical protein